MRKFFLFALVISMFATTGFSLSSSLSAKGAGVSVVSGVEGATPQAFAYNEPSQAACVGAVARAAYTAVTKAVTKAAVYVSEAAKAYGDELDRVMRDASMYVGGIASGDEEVVEEIFDLN